MFNLDCWLEWEKGKFVQFFEAVSELSKSLEHSNTSGRWILARIYQISDEKHALIWDLGNSSWFDFLSPFPPKIKIGKHPPLPSQTH